MPDKKILDSFLKLQESAFEISGVREAIKGGICYYNIDGTACFIFLGPLKPLGEFSFCFQWRKEKGTYELLFGSSAWEGLFKTSSLMRDYLDLVLSDLISYKQRLDRLLK